MVRGHGTARADSYEHTSLSAPSVGTAKAMRKHLGEETLLAEGTVCEPDESQIEGGRVVRGVSHSVLATRPFRSRSDASRAERFATSQRTYRISPELGAYEKHVNTTPSSYRTCGLILRFDWMRHPPRLALRIDHLRLESGQHKCLSTPEASMKNS